MCGTDAAHVIASRVSRPFRACSGCGANPGLRSFVACPGLCCIAPLGLSAALRQPVAEHLRPAQPRPPSNSIFSLLKSQPVQVRGMTNGSSRVFASPPFLSNSRPDSRPASRLHFHSDSRPASRLHFHPDSRPAHESACPNGATQQSPGQAAKERSPGKGHHDSQALKGRDNRENQPAPASSLAGHSVC